MATIEDSSYFGWQGTFRLWIDPHDHWFAYAEMWPAHEHFTQPLILVEEVGTVAKPVPLQQGWVVVLRALLQAEHYGAEVIVRHVWNFNADEQDITVLRQ